MKLFGLGMPELVIILIVILIIFGPKNLPKLGAALGKGMKNLRDGMGAGKKEAKKADAAQEPAAEQQAAPEELPVVEAEVSEVEAAEEAPKKKVVRVVKKTEE